MIVSLGSAGQISGREYRPDTHLSQTLSFVQSTVQTLNSCTKCTGRPGITYVRNLGWATSILGYGCDCMHLTSQLGVSWVHRLVGYHIGIIIIFFLYVNCERLENGSLTDVRSTGAGIKSLHLSYPRSRPVQMKRSIIRPGSGVHPLISCFYPSELLSSKQSRRSNTVTTVMLNQDWHWT